jgi:8-oxo-dGTP pyrophosphatase MutT (NUDIX family)
MLERGSQHAFVVATFVRSYSFNSTLKQLGHGAYVVVVLSVGSPNATNIIFVLQREPRADKAWLPSGIVLPDAENLYAIVRELLEETD